MRLFRSTVRMGFIWALFLTIMLLYVSFPGCSQVLAEDGDSQTYGYFDTEPGVLNLHANVAFTHVSVITVGIARGLVPTPTGGWEYADSTFAMEGSGIVVGDYIATVAHIIKPKRVTFPVAQWEYYNTYTTEILNSYTFICFNSNIGLQGLRPVDVVFLDEISDLALLKYKGNNPSVFYPTSHQTSATYLRDFRFRIFPPFDKLMYGAAVAGIFIKQDENGYRTDEFEVRTGTVISRTVTGIADLQALTDFNAEHFSISIPVISGDSGTGIFAFQNGKPVLIGIVSRMHSVLEYSYPVRIDKLLRLIAVE